jgi:DNA-binding response OmpR family regulator
MLDAHGGAYLVNPQSVLIVDDHEDAREVLRTALARRGVKTLEAARVDAGLSLARQYRPDVIVLSMESEYDDSALRGELEAQSRAADTRLILLGKMPRRASHEPADEFIAKPYHYAPLVRKIEELLTVARNRLARCA